MTGLFPRRNPLHNGGMIYGYARLSTDGQTVRAQVEALTAAGATKVFLENASGAKTDRAQLRGVLGQFVIGDRPMVTQLDSRAASTRELLNSLSPIAGRKAGFRSLGYARADTMTAHGGLILTVFGGLAEFEREPISLRTGEGRRQAAARDVQLDHKPRLTAHQMREVIEHRRRGEPMREIARGYNVDRASILSSTL